MEWAELMHLGRDAAAYREFRGYLETFESNPAKWTRYYGYQVTMRRYEDIYGNPIRYGRMNTKKVVL